MANLSFVFEAIKDDDAGTSVELDTTLTKAGAAADALSVGQAIIKAFANAATKGDLAGLATEDYVDGKISDALSKFDTDIKAYIQNTFLNGAW